MDMTVTDVPERTRYEAREGARLLGILTYHRKLGQVVFDHTEVEPDARGRGIGGALAAAALADAREDELEVVPSCSYVRRWIEAHPEYLPLVAEMPRHHR